MLKLMLKEYRKSNKHNRILLPGEQNRVVKFGREAIYGQI